MSLTQVLRTSRAKEYNDVPRRLLTMEDAASVIVASGSASVQGQLKSLVMDALKKGTVFTVDRDATPFIEYQAVTAEEVARELAGGTGRWSLDQADHAVTSEEAARENGKTNGKGNEGGGKKSRGSYLVDVKACRKLLPKMKGMPAKILTKLIELDVKEITVEAVVELGFNKNTFQNSVSEFWKASGAVTSKKIAKEEEDND